MSDRDERRLAAVYRTFGAAAVWRPAGGPADGFAVTLMRAEDNGVAPQDLPLAAQARRNTPRRLYRLRAGEAAAHGFTPQRGDGVEVGGESLAISDAPRREDRALSEWTFLLG